MLNKNKNFKKSENLTLTFRETPTLCFSSYKNRKSNVKLRWVGAHKSKKRVFFCNVYFLRINFQNVYTLTYRKTLLQIFFWLFSKSYKAFSKAWLIHDALCDLSIDSFKSTLMSSILTPLSIPDIACFANQWTNVLLRKCLEGLLIKVQILEVIC